MFNSNMPSLSDIAAVTNNNDGFGGNNGWWVLILLFAIFGGWGNGGYGNGAANNYVLASDFATLQRQIDSATSDLKQATTSIGNGLSSLGYDQLSQMNGINNNINTAQNNLMAQLNAMQANFSQCCCEQKYQLAEQSCQTRQAVADGTASIIANNNANTQRLVDMLNAMQTNALQDKIAALQAENSNLRFEASQQAQNATIISALGGSCNCCVGRNA